MTKTRIVSKEEIFWNWFLENNSNYYYINQMSESEDKENLLEDFLKQHIYCEKLYFEIDGCLNDGLELIISAEGDTKLFLMLSAR
jgi:hypothetical protein